MSTYTEGSLQGGIPICGIRFFKSIQVQYLISKYGLIKVFEVLVLLFCQKLVYDAGRDEHRKPIKDNIYLVVFLVTNMALLQAFTFLLIYTLSSHTFLLVRKSVLEIVSNLLLVLGFIITVLFIAFKSGFFANPAQFFTGREDETSETLIYFMTLLLVLAFAFDAFMARGSYVTFNKESPSNPPQVMAK